LTGHVFSWTADPACAYYAERALFNGILGTQHPADGSKLYYVPLASGYWKLFGTPLHDFWCCTGSDCESFAKHPPSDDLSSWIKPVPGRPLEFRTEGQAQDVTLVPLCTLFDERYAVYWRFKSAEPSQG
jgi:Beta-L-arabinofuranosidase, GH127 catalytic domain